MRCSVCYAAVVLQSALQRAPRSRPSRPTRSLASTHDDHRRSMSVAALLTRANLESYTPALDGCDSVTSLLEIDPTHARTSSSRGTSLLHARGRRCTARQPSRACSARLSWAWLVRPRVRAHTVHSPRVREPDDGTSSNVYVCEILVGLLKATSCVVGLYHLRVTPLIGAAQRPRGAHRARKVNHRRPPDVCSALCSTTAA